MSSLLVWSVLKSPECLNEFCSSLMLISMSISLGRACFCVSLPRPVAGGCAHALRFAEALEVYGAQTTHVRAPAVGSRPSLDDVQAALDAKPYKLVTITHVDTSTGVLMDVEVSQHVELPLHPSVFPTVRGCCCTLCLQG